jgi:hypothetical protein
LDDEPEEPDFEPDFELEDPDFEVLPRLDELEDFEAEDLDEEDDERVVEAWSPEICFTIFFAPSSTASPTSPTRLIAKSLTVSTPSWTLGWFQRSSAVLRICS